MLRGQYMMAFIWLRRFSFHFVSVEWKTQPFGPLPFASVSSSVASSVLTTGSEARFWQNLFEREFEIKQKLS